MGRKGHLSTDAIVLIEEWGNTALVLMGIARSRGAIQDFDICKMICDMKRISKEGFSNNQVPFVDRAAIILSGILMWAFKSIYADPMIIAITLRLQCTVNNSLAITVQGCARTIIGSCYCAGLVGLVIMDGVVVTVGLVEELSGCVTTSAIVVVSGAIVLGFCGPGLTHTSLQSQGCAHVCFS